MKRLTAALLLLAMLLLTACGSGSLVQTETGAGETLIRTTGEKKTEDAGSHNTTGFQAGFGRGDITPTISVPLAGYGNTMGRFSTNVLDNLYATCVALRDEAGETVLIYHLDIVKVWTKVGEQVRNMISNATGVPYDNIILNASHTHSGPAGDSADGSIDIWKGLLYKACVSAAQDAIADLDRCESVSTGATETDRLNFVRRYYKENGFVCDNADYGTGAITGHETEVDEEMRLIVFKRENQKDIVMANWQCHPHRTGGSTKYDLSADIIGSMRARVEGEMGYNFLYLQGGAGNINPTSRISGEARFGNYQDIGKALAEHLAEGLNDLTETNVTTLRAERFEYEGTVNHADDDKVGIARQVNSLVTATSRAEANALAVANGMSSAFEAGAIITRSTLPEKASIELTGVAFGDVAIVTAPFEMFCQTEKQLRADSPFRFTFTLGYTNSSQGYMPAAEVWDNKGYEVVTCHYVKGTAEEISAQQLAILGRLYENK